MFNKLNYIVRSFAYVNDLILPLRIDIKNICDYADNEVEYIVTDLKMTSEEINYTIDETESPFKSQYAYQRLHKMIDRIWKNVDLSLPKVEGQNNLISLFNIQTYEDFCEVFIHSDMVDFGEIRRVLDVIIFHENRIKKMFVDDAKIMLELDKEYPNIPPLKKDDFSMYIEKFSEHFGYNYEMTSLQSVSEYPMDIWFPENVGKSYMEWSWREQELKRMYLTAKYIKDSFKEAVKAKGMEISREKQNAKSKQPGRKR